MDHIYLKQLARLKFALRREKMGTVDLERFESNAQYARRVLETAEEASVEEIVTLAVELRHKRGLLGVSANAPAEIPRQTPNPRSAREVEKPAAAERKYMFGARG